MRDLTDLARVWPFARKLVLGGVRDGRGLAEHQPDTKQQLSIGEL